MATMTKVLTKRYISMSVVPKHIYDQLKDLNLGIDGTMIDLFNRYERYGDNGSNIVIALDGDMVIGWCATHPYELSGIMLYTHEDFRGQGIATQLMEQWLKNCTKKLGYVVVYRPYLKKTMKRLVNEMGLNLEVEQWW